MPPTSPVIAALFTAEAQLGLVAERVSQRDRPGRRGLRGDCTSAVGLEG